LYGIAAIQRFLNDELGLPLSKSATQRLLADGCPHGQIGRNKIGDKAAIRAYLRQRAGGF